MSSTMKGVWVWSLGCLVLVFALADVFMLKDYAAFYHLPPMLTSALAVVLVFLNATVLLWSERYPHRWKRYIPFWLALFVLGLFVPGVSFDNQLTDALTGAMPVLLMICIWLIKRYVTVRAN
ncbi:hypothetical protein GTB64_004542 [Salmonella enterica]|nr:hypothetical protein [Salmonella enterica]